MKTGFLITARLKSTRLPGKLLLPVNDREMIAWMIDRLKLCRSVDALIIATSVNPEDEPLCSLAQREGVGCFRGSEADVLARLYEAAQHHRLDYIINITADCPLVAYDYIDRVVSLYRETDADLVTSLKLPHGLFVYGIKVTALRKVLDLKNDDNTEVWGTYFTDTGLFNVAELDVPPEIWRPNYRLTLDYPEDYEFFKKVFDGLGPDTYKLPSQEIIRFLDDHPEIVATNAHCEELYKARWESQKKMVLK